MIATVLYNTKTLTKEELRPLEPGHVRIYSCGPTVYSPQHIGNLRPYLFADLLRRSLWIDGLRVTHVINVTDVAAEFVRGLDFEDALKGVAHVENIGTGHPQTLAEFAGHWWEKFGATGELQLGHIPYRHNEIMRLVPDIGQPIQG